MTNELMGKISFIVSIEETVTRICIIISILAVTAGSVSETSFSRIVIMIMIMLMMMIT